MDAYPPTGLTPTRRPEFWADLPARTVVYLRGLSPQALALALEPLPPDAPAVVTFRAGQASAPTAGLILDELDTCARELFPAWLPGAENLDGPTGGGIAAVRAIALRAAASTPDHGPFLADLAERSLRGIAAGRSRFVSEVRAPGLARVIAASYHRTELALIVEIPEGRPPAAESALVIACERLAFHGRFAVWLTGAPLRSVDRVPVIDIGPARPAPPPVPVNEARTTFPAVAGRPHPASAAEQALETALAGHDWAIGRAWNQTYEIGALANPVRLDLLWSAERCVVEVDGPEHYTEPRYEADRRRDVDLQLAGYAVLRFTNAQIHHDVHAVLARIEQFLRDRRALLKLVAQKG